MNKVIELGRIATDLDLRFTEEQKAVLKFRIAVQKKGTETNFFDCAAFGKTAETIGKYFKKGDRILIGGKLDANQYTTKDGKKATAISILVDEFNFIEKKEEPKEEPKEAEEELPFKF